MKRIGLAVLAVAVMVSVLGVALLQRGNDAKAQATKSPILVMEVASWAKGDVDPTTWQWQALENGELHVAFWAPGKMACAEIALPPGTTFWSRRYRATVRGGRRLCGGFPLRRLRRS